jgi:beta-phosphoglucomutase
LKQKNQPIALGSASKNAKPILQKVNLLSDFDAIVDGNDVSRAKPDPEVFVTAANLLKIEPKECIVFEDSVAGVEAANVAGMVSIGIGSETVLGHADHVFQDFTQISDEFLNQLINN